MAVPIDRQKHKERTRSGQAMALAHNDRPNFPFTVSLQTVAEQWGICGTTPALKWAMVAYFDARSPLKVWGITKTLQCFGARLKTMRAPTANRAHC
jgi:hypothetical protein